MNTTRGPQKERIAELMAEGYRVHAISDQSPCVYGWFHESGASQSDVRDRQPFRTSAIQAWDDCSAYATGSVPPIANPDWMTK